MKKTFTFLLLSFICAFGAFSQTTLILQPDSCLGKDTRISSCVPCGYDIRNDGGSDELSAIAWTNGGNVSNGRGLLAFDLSSIPTSAVVSSAKLSLYWNPNPASGNAGHSILSGPNDGWLQRVTSNWGEFLVSWDTQPTTTTQNEVAIPASVSNSQDYPNIDVTALVQDMVYNPSQSFGFMLRLQNENYYRSLMFASSDHANSALHPKLEITYTVPDTTICLYIQPERGACGTAQDSRISSCVPCGYDNLNAGLTDELSAEAWTNGGNISNGRGLIEFDLSAIPSTATVTGASLSLYWNPDPASGNVGQSTLSGPNDGWLQRITSSWQENTVTWNNQPTTTTQNEVAIPSSISNTEDYPNIDVTTLAQDMVSNPAQSFGFMLRLQNETYYRALLFASRNHPNSALHPILQICYTTVAAPPVTSFQTSDTIICVNDCINFTDLSSNATSWKWTFNGANPSYSTAQNPQNICYLTPGPYDVSLIASNSIGSDTVISVHYINVNAAPPTPTLTTSHDTLFCTTDTSYAFFQWYYNSNLIPGATKSYVVFSVGGNYNVSITGKTGCKTAVGIVLGLQNYFADNLISISPNPAGSELTIHTSSFRNEAVTISVLGMLGNVVQEEKINWNNDYKLSIKTLSSGIYFLQMKSEHGSVVKRFVKE